MNDLALAARLAAVGAALSPTAFTHVASVVAWHAPPPATDAPPTSTPTSTATPTSFTVTDPDPAAAAAGGGDAASDDADDDTGAGEASRDSAAALDPRVNWCTDVAMRR